MHWCCRIQGWILMLWLFGGKGLSKSHSGLILIITSTSLAYDVDEQPSAQEELVLCLKTVANWVDEGTVILLATRFLVVTLAWLIDPIVREITVKSGQHILLGGGALTVVLFFRFFVLSRIRYGPAQFWVILFVLWFLEICYFGSTVDDSPATQSIHL